MLLLLSCWILTGLRAEASPTWHYQMTNSSLCWKVGKSLPCNDSMWLLNAKVIVSHKNVTTSYKHIMDYNPRNCSLCFNKLRKTDTGRYKLLVINIDDSAIEETHELLVQDAVPTPVVRMSAVHFNLSGEFCNITVNCSIQDEWVWSVCVEDSCRTSQGSSQGSLNITVSAENRTVTCSGNNHVSTSSISVSTEAMCFSNSKSEQEEKSQPSSLIATVTVVTLCAFVCFIFVAKRLFSTKSNHQQTSPARLVQDQPAEARPQPAPRVSTTSSSDEPSYENVDAPQPSQTSGQIELGSKQSQQVDTVYSFLQVSNVTTAETV